MVPKTRRLGKKEIEELFHKGQAQSLGGISVLFAPSRIALARVALILPGKIKLSAVEKNRIKRQLYPIIRPYLPKLPPHRDYAFRLSHRFISLPRTARTIAFQKALQSLLSRHE